MKERLNFFSNYLTDDDSSSQKSIVQTETFVNVWAYTSLIIWAYISVAFMLKSNSQIIQAAIIHAVIFMSIPLVLKYTKNILLSVTVMSLTVLSFQVVYSLMNSGIDSFSTLLFIAHAIVLNIYRCRKITVLCISINIIGIIAFTLFTKVFFLQSATLESTSIDYMTTSALILFNIILAVYAVRLLTRSEEHLKETEKKNTFISDMIRITAHDVNSSISKTNLICSILKKELNKEQNEYNNISIDYLKNKIEMINKSNNQIKEISASAARWIKNSETEGDLQLLPLKFQDVINHITDSFNLIVENKNITLNFDCAKTLQSTILVNPEAFRNQVVNNIISNAIKFTHSGSSITIKSTIREKSLYLSIIDQGDGIEDKIMKNIYNPSKSISTNGTAGEIGTGLGMPIVKNFIERMGGSLAISSVHKNSIRMNSLLMSGTTTTLTVPLSR